MAHGDDLVHGGHRAEGIGDVRDRDQLRSRVQEPLHFIETQLAARVHRHHLEPGAALGGEHLPWNDVGVVFEVRDQDLIAFTEITNGHDLITSHSGDIALEILRSRSRAGDIAPG